MFTNIKNSAIAIATTAILTGCQMSESIRYVHEPSEIFYENFDITKLKQTPFIDGKIVFAVSIKEAGFDRYWVWLGFYTKEKAASIAIKTVSIISNGQKKDIIIDNSLLINEITERDSKVYDLRTNGLKLIEISAEEIEKFINKDNTMKIEVKYIIDDEIKNMIFTIEQKVEKRVIYPT